MNRTVLATLAILACSGCSPRDSAVTNTPPAFSAEDESAVRNLVNGFANSWNQHDMNAMHELDAEDVDWINVVGHHWRGKKNVYTGHTALHNGMASGSTMSVESMTVRSIAPGVAVAVATMHFGASPDPRYSPLGGAADSRGSFTTVKRNGVWKIVHFQNTNIDPRANQDATKWEGPGYPLFPNR